MAAGRQLVISPVKVRQPAEQAGTADCIRRVHLLLEAFKLKLAGRGEQT